MADSRIHPSAIVDPGAKIGANVSIGAFSIIESGVSIGDGCEIRSHAVIKSGVRLGINNRIFQFCSIGDEPQDLKYDGEPTLLEIGDNNVFREYCSINRGTAQATGVTRIGSDNLFMAYVHIAHDCQIGSNTIFANCSSLGGHVVVQDYAILGGFTIVHQFCRIGAHCFCGMGSSISKDVPPYTMIAGTPTRPRGINAEGLKRRGFAAEDIQVLKDSYKQLFRSGRKLTDVVVEMGEDMKQHPILEISHAFLSEPGRGLLR